MATQENDDGGHGPKGCLIVASLLAGIMCCVISAAIIDNLGIALVVMVVVWFGYPALGGIAAQTCDDLRLWAYDGDVKHFDREEKILLGAFWPAALLGCTILYTFLKIIKRAY